MSSWAVGATADGCNLKVFVQNVLQYQNRIIGSCLQKLQVPLTEHGYSQPNKLLYSYLKGSDYNVICLDWDKLATIGVYLDAAINSNTVGDFVGEKLVADIFIATVRDF